MNPVRRKSLLELSCGGMEFTWRYAWVYFLALILLKRSFPLLESLAVFALASVIAILNNHRIQRVYQALGQHVIGFGLAWLFIIHRYYYRDMPFWQKSWLVQELQQLQQSGQWLIRLLLFACLLLYWTGARAMAKRSADYSNVCLQFDKGISALFLMLLIRFIVEIKGGPHLTDAATPFLIFAFFTFSLIAISLSRNENEVDRTYRAGYRGIGIVLSSTTLFMVGGAILIALFLPYLAQIADSTHLALKKTTEPMGPVLVYIIRFLFSIGRYRQEMGEQIFSESSADHLFSDAEIVWAQGFGWFLVVLIGLITLWLCSYVIRLLIKWFLNRKKPERTTGLKLHPFIRLVAIIGAIFQLALSGLTLLVKRIDSAAATYASMLRWGRRSGLPAAASETPLEYGRRLVQGFPQLQTEIELIVRAFNREIYGQVRSDKKILISIQRARRRMRNPRHWPVRLKTWFTAPAHSVRITEFTGRP